MKTFRYKDQAAAAEIEAIAIFERQSGSKVKVVRTDRGRDLLCAELHARLLGAEGHTPRMDHNTHATAERRRGFTRSLPSPTQLYDWPYARNPPMSLSWGDRG